MRKIFRHSILLLFLLLLLPAVTRAQCWVSALAVDMRSGTSEFRQFIKSSEGAFEAYKRLYTAGRSTLRKDTEALAAFYNTSRNSKLKELGFTDELLASVNGYSDASFAELMNDLNRFGNLIHERGTKITNFRSMIDILKGKNQNYRQGVHWILQDLIEDAVTFKGKTIKFEERLANARETFSFVDVFCADCSPAALKVEYKSGPGSITKTTIKEQFIERDLFAATDLREIQWRMKETEFNSDKLKSWMKENRETINSLLADENVGQKFRTWFNLNEADDMVLDIHIEKFVDNNYSLIFK